MKNLLLTLVYLFASFSFADDLDNYISACKDLGFRQGTEKLGDCVLELKRRDGGYVTPSAKNQSKSKSSKQNSNNQQYEAQANEFFRQQQDLYDMQMAKYQREEAEYLRQRKEYEEQKANIEREKEKRRGMKLMEFGLRALSGTSPNAVTNFSNASADTMGIPRLPEPQRPTMQLQENYRITTPSGNLVNCRYDPNIRQATCY